MREVDRDKARDGIKEADHKEPGHETWSEKDSVGSNEKGPDTATTRESARPEYGRSYACKLPSLLLAS